MRVTQKTNFDTVQKSIQDAKGRLSKLQLQASSLKKLNRPSEDPVGSAKLLELRTEGVLLNQFQTNAHLAEAFLKNTDHALEELSDIVLRAKDIALSQSSGASASAQSRLGVAEEIGQLFHQSVSIANSKMGNRFLFGGYQTQTPPVDPQGNDHSDHGEITVEIAKGVFATINVPGKDVFKARLARSELGEKNQSEKVQLFKTLQALHTGLLTNDLDTIRSTLDRLDALHGQLVSIRSKVGSRTQGIQNTVQIMERQGITNADLSSQISDADMAEVMSGMALEETVYRSALSSAKRLLQPTLVDFLS